MQTVEELELEISELTIAISNILKAGQSYMINSGGGSRSVTMADYDKLIARKKEAQADLACVSGSLGGMIGKAW